MDKDFLDKIKESMELEDLVPNEVAPLILAYIGDAVYDVIVRTLEISKGNRQVNKINKDSIKLVNAKAQADMIDYLEEKLTDNELAIYKRGRNAKANTSAKNASIRDYRKATGFEALIGYLYLSHQEDRMLELVKEGFDSIENRK